MAVLILIGLQVSFVHANDWVVLINSDIENSLSVFRL